MPAPDLALVRGIADTRATLASWNAMPWGVVGRWLAGSLGITAGLLGAVWTVAALSTPDLTPLTLPGLHTEPSLGAAAEVIGRNSLVLALHAMACVAGFIAGSSMPLEAERHRGIMRWVHEKAGPLAIGFVMCATAFSLLTQAMVLGQGAADLAAQLGTSPGVLLVALMPHALPELVALFLPLAAWMIASRRGDWHELLAATFVTVLLAAPVLAVASVVEVYVTPRILLGLGG